MTITVFSWNTELGKSSEFVGQVEQMYASGCFVGSAGKLGCISCHDPHRIPQPAQKVTFYRQRCLACHEPGDCGLSEAQRRASVESDACQLCHMPARTTNLRHVASTDHRILRRPADGSSPAADERLPSDGFPIVAFPPQRDPATVPARDRAIGLLVAMVERPDRVLPQHIRQVIPDLREAVRKRPDDFDAWEALGQAWRILGRNTEAAACYRQVLTQQPLRELSLASLGQLSTASGDYPRAVECFQMAYRLRPNHPRYAAELAFAVSQQGRWQEALAIAQRASQKFPESVDLRQLVISADLHLGKKEKAEAAFRDLQRFEPEQLEEIRKWYDHLSAEH